MATGCHCRGAFVALLAAIALLLGWGLVHLVVGAVITVLPFPFLPFVPEQTAAHYLAHFLYGLAQVPLIAAMFGHLRASEGAPRAEALN